MNASNQTSVQDDPAAAWTVDVDRHLDAAYDENYLALARATFPAELNRQNAELVWRLGALQPGSCVLDVPCGFGRVSLELARKGARVTGIDRSAAMIGEARRQASEMGVDATFEQGDIRQLQIARSADAVLCWGLSFGYFDDPTNRQVLQQLRAAVRPGGRLILETLNPGTLHTELNNAVSSPFYPRQGVLLPAAADGDFSLDDITLDPEGTRLISHRTVFRDGARHSMTHTMRLFSAAELRGWLTGAGFTAVELFDEFGRPFGWRSRHIVAVAN